MKEKYEPKEFLVFEDDNSVVNYVKRSEIVRFIPEYTHPRGYIIYAETKLSKMPVHKEFELENAKFWIMEQIQKLETESPKAEKAAREKANG